LWQIENDSSADTKILRFMAGVYECVCACARARARPHLPSVCLSVRPSVSCLPASDCN